MYVLKIYFKETTMAEQSILKKQHYILKKQQCWTMLKKQQWMKYILKKQQWLNNIF